MACCALTFWLCKAGNPPEEYEDAFQCSPLLGRFAIADGATESSFAGEWARILVRAFTTDSFLTVAFVLQDLQQWLEPLQREWFQSINWEGLPWFAEEKAHAGAFSTLLGLSFEPSDRRENPSTCGCWHAFAVGDSCLFQIRNDSLVRSFPITKSQEFSSCPALLSSKEDSNRRIWGHVCFAEGNYQPDDLFLLTTDALGHWFLDQYEKGAKPWIELSKVSDQGEFERFITCLRQEGVIRNDDTTLIAIPSRVIASESE